MGTQETHDEDQQKKTSNTDLIKKRGWDVYHGVKRKQFPSLIRHVPCFSYIQDVFDTIMYTQKKEENR